MNVELAEERIFILADRFSMEVAEGRAWTKRTDAFGTLARLGGFLKQPKDEDFELIYRERRLQPFWRLVCATTQVYERRRTYAVPVAAEVRAVSFGGEDHAVGGGQFTFEGLEACRLETRRDTFFDGFTKERKPELADYIRHDGAPATAETLATAVAEGTIVAPSEARASTLVRDVVAASIERIEADKVLEETVRLEAIDLYYRPVYAFRYRWQGKEAVVEFDALSGEARAGGSTFEQHLGKMLEPKFLLDVGAEAINMVIPGANLAKMAIVKGIEMSKRG